MEKDCPEEGTSGSTWEANAGITDDPYHQGLHNQPPSHCLCLVPGNQNWVEEVVFTGMLEDVKSKNTLAGDLE